jgi:ribosomal-protein-alanine N-acetyltransferase
MILQTPRLTLRPLSRDDAPAMHGLMSDADVMAFWDVPPIEDPELTARILESQIAAMEHGTTAAWSMARTQDLRFVGCCDLSQIDRWHHRAELGFITDRDFWGEGLAHEALQAVIDHAAQHLRMRRLSARTHLGNVRSVRLLEKLGFVQEGVLRGHVERVGERRDCLIFGLLL